MKRFLLVLVVAAALTLTSCGWIHENLLSVEDCTEWYVDKLADAVEDDDSTKFCDLFVDFNKWLSGLTKEEQNEVVKECLEEPLKLSVVLQYAENFGLYLY